MVSALNEIKKLRKKNQNLKLLLQEGNGEKNKVFQVVENAEKLIIDLKIQIDKGKKREEEIRSQLKLKEENCKRLEVEIVSLRKLDKSSTLLNHEKINHKSSMSLDDILGSQKQSTDKGRVVLE